MTGRSSWLLQALFVSLAIATSARAEPVTKVTRSPIGIPVEVTAGQEFYAETLVQPVPGYRLDRPFKSSMGGAMGLPFSFAIDSVNLVRVRSDAAGWQYFVPEDGRFRASHGLLGSVINEGDTVGLRVHESGKMEWFVDNSVHNGMTTIWSRRVKDKDPKVARIEVASREQVGSSIERLVYLGLDSNNRARIRHERIMARDILRDEFTFALDSRGVGLGAVRGAEFMIEAGQLRARMTVTKPMTSGLGDPQNP